MDKLEKSHNYTNESFEDIKHIDEEGIEFWYAKNKVTIVFYIKTWYNIAKFDFKEILYERSK